MLPPVKGFIQIFREAVEIKKDMYKKLTLNKDTGETYLRPFIMSLQFGFFNITNIATNIVACCFLVKVNLFSICEYFSHFDEEEFYKIPTPLQKKTVNNFLELLETVKAYKIRNRKKT